MKPVAFDPMLAFLLSTLLTPVVRTQGPVPQPDTPGHGVSKQMALPGERPDIPPPPKAVQQLPQHQDVPIPIGTGGLPQPVDPAAEVLAPSTQPVTGTGAFTYFLNRPVKPAGASHSLVAEPSSAIHRDTAFQTGNWYGAVSGDSGMTWTHVNPYMRFPASDGGFCCDQRVLHVATHDITIWLLQYTRGPTGNNRYRIAVCRGRANLLDSNGTPNPWYFYDYTPQGMGLPSARWFDFPDIAITATNLHVSANVYDTSAPNPVFQQAVRWRISLDDLRDGVTFPRWSYNTALAGFTFRFTQGAPGPLMWFGSINSTTSLRVYQFDETWAVTTFDDRTIAAFTTTTPVAPGPDGRDWASRAVGRIRGAWATPAEIGFMFGSGPNGTARPNGYTRVSRFRTTDRTLIADNDIWGTTYTYLYAAGYGNPSGDVGCVIALGGGDRCPSTAAFIIDAYDPWPPAEITLMSVGTHGPYQNRWGDYYTVQTHPSLPRTWIGTGAAQNGGPGDADNEPRHAWFGRNDFEPNWVYLNVRSTPVLGIAIAQSETDLNGVKNGTTPYTRRFPPQARYTLTAPLTSSSGGTTYQFDRWAFWPSAGGSVFLQPVDQRTLAIDSIGTTDDTAEARYLARRTLTVQSTDPAAGVAITASAPDVFGLQDGTTPFTRVYKQTYGVTLTAPAAVGSGPFRRWRLNGVDQPLGLVTLTVTLGAANATAVADYAIHVPGSFTPFGVGCGSNGPTVQTAAGTPEIGRTVTYSLAFGRPFSAAILVLGFSDTSWAGIPLPLLLGASAPGCSILVSVDATFPTATNQVGSASFPIPIPPDPSLIDGHAYTQYWCVDPLANPLNLTFSNGIDTRIGGDR